MKSLDEIKHIKRFSIYQIGEDGISGFLQMAHWGASLIISWGGGWEHLSVSPMKKNIIPTWSEMSYIKDLFFYDDEAVIQIHPPKDEYVNNMTNCLHLWRCTYKDMVLPPSCFVGIKEGQTPSELREELKKAYEMAGESYE